MQRVNFIFNGAEFTATFDGDGECVSIYSWNGACYLKNDPETNERENPGVWTAAYTMREE